MTPTKPKSENGAAAAKDHVPDIGPEYAIIVLHEIYGLNDHIKGVCGRYRDRGFDVFCPELTGRPEPFGYGEEEAAYHNFRKNGFGPAYQQVKGLGEGIRPIYRKVILIGFSVGATLGWLLAGRAVIGNRAIRWSGFILRLSHQRQFTYSAPLPVTIDFRGRGTGLSASRHTGRA